MREKIIDAIRQEGLIAIVRGIEKEKLIPLAEAMYRGGVRLLEITYSANGAVSDAETADRIGMLKQHFGTRMYIGAGTVLSAEQVKLTHAAGGEFIISPDCNADVIMETKRLGLVSIPGAFSPTEAQQAHRTGADFVKLFPVTNLGADYVKAISAPLSHVAFLAVGGIDLDNMRTYKKAGVCGFGIGSNIIDRRMLDQNDFAGIEALAHRYVAAAKEGF